MAKRTTLRVLIVLHFLKLRAADLAAFIAAVAGKVTGDPDDPSPVVPPATMLTQGSDLASTIVARETDKSKALTQTFNNQVNIVLNSLTATAGQIEQIANDKANGNLTIGYEVVTRFGFRYKLPSIRPGIFFEVYRLMAPGKVWLRCPAAPDKKTAIYLWRCSKTPMQPESWSTPVQTTTAKVNITELDSDTRYYFQYFVVLNPGRGRVIDINDPQIAWSDAISALVM